MVFFGGDSVFRTLESYRVYFIKSPDLDVEIAVHRTKRWMDRSLSVKSDNRQKLFGIIQGGIFTEFR